ncbi:energy transducer TonB [Granulicella arctica]|uniref:TonB family protein n=1 Tax=Granulicella arctica TaxID=940613 RepID=A0A7Y9TTA3_9BACT|nr:energy transducer TonB [Granulicella arctica]NYF79783.1 TonB family protein [Granulicella arctica]
MKSGLPLALFLSIALPFVHAQTPVVNDEPITPPTIVYPAEAKQKHIQGTVELEVRVSETGRVTAVKALSGPEELRQAAVDAYSLASYKPMIRAGKAVPAVVTTKVDFSLHEAPPSPDDLVAKDFEPVHEQCETLERAKDANALGVCQQALDIAGRFTPTGHMVAHAVAFNDVALVLLRQGKPKEAAAVGENAVTTVADAYPGSLAAANAYITRAETRLRVHDLKRSLEDCVEAERILHGLLDQALAPYLAQDMKAQLKGVLRLHAVVLRENHQAWKAKPLEDEADKL